MEAIEEESAKQIAQSTSDKQIIFELIKDEREWVRGCLSVNPHISIDDREQLAKDKHRIVRSLVAASSLTPLEILVRLGHDYNWRVRYMIAYNKDFVTLKALLTYKFATPQPYESVMERLFEIIDQETSEGQPISQEMQVTLINAYNKFSELNNDISLQVEYRKKVKTICKDSSLAQIIKI